MKKLINPQFGFLSESLDRFSDIGYFNTNGELLYDVGRNVVKRFLLEGVDVVVKRFGHITAFNRLMYGTVRESKAKRAYLYASKLRELGVSTPEEVAVLETYRKGTLKESYFVSVYSDCQSLSFLHEFTFGRQELYPVLDALSIWIAEIHDKGILHHDLNVGNILYKELPDGEFAFQLIDNNRMTFHRHLTIEERLKNICKLSANFELYHYVMSRYAERLSYDLSQMEMKGLFYKWRLEYGQVCKKKVKAVFRRR